MRRDRTCKRDWYDAGELLVEYIGVREAIPSRRGRVRQSTVGKEHRQHVWFGRSDRSESQRVSATGVSDILGHRFLVLTRLRSLLHVHLLTTSQRIPVIQPDIPFFFCDPVSASEYARSELGIRHGESSVIGKGPDER